jgi:hypothetical protein
LPLDEKNGGVSFEFFIVFLILGTAFSTEKRGIKGERT